MVSWLLTLIGDTMPADKLLPCPFCKGTPSIYERTCEKWDDPEKGGRAFPILRCMCGAGIEGNDWEDGTTLIPRWNRRAK